MMNYFVILTEATMVTTLIIITIGLTLYMFIKKDEYDDERYAKRIGLAILVFGTVITMFTAEKIYDGALRNNALAYVYKWGIENGSGDFAKEYYGRDEVGKQKIQDMIKSADMEKGRLGTKYNFHWEDDREYVRLYIDSLFNTYGVPALPAAVILGLGFIGAKTLVKSRELRKKKYDESRKEYPIMLQKVNNLKLEKQDLENAIMEIKNGAYTREIEVYKQLKNENNKLIQQNSYLKNENDKLGAEIEEKQQTLEIVYKGIAQGKLEFEQEKKKVEEIISLREAEKKTLSRVQSQLKSLNEKEVNKAVANKVVEEQRRKKLSTDEFRQLMGE